MNRKVSALGRVAALWLTGLLMAVPAWAGDGVIRNGALWPDGDGVHVNAHGGGVLWHKGRYYWYGEYKSDSTSNALVGITCYSSKNLTDWRNEGVVLPVCM